MGYGYIDDLARKKKAEFPGCASAIEEHVTIIKQRLANCEYSDAYSTEDEFLTRVLGDARLRKKVRRRRMFKPGGYKRV